MVVAYPPPQKKKKKRGGLESEFTTAVSVSFTQGTLSCLFYSNLQNFTYKLRILGILSSFQVASFFSRQVLIVNVTCLKKHS